MGMLEWQWFSDPSETETLEIPSEAALFEKQKINMKTKSPLFKTVYVLALLLFSRNFSHAQGIGSTNDLWDVSRGVTIIRSSPLENGAIAPKTYDARDIFGGRFGNYSPEPERVVFADRQPPGFVHFVEWRTPNPVTIRSFSLHAVGDTSGSREFATFTLKAKSPEAATFDITLFTFTPTHKYKMQDNATYLLISSEVQQTTAQEFRAEFVTLARDDIPGFNSGPRILELDGFGLPKGAELSTGQFRNGSFEAPAGIPASSGVFFKPGDANLRPWVIGGTNALSGIGYFNGMVPNLDFPPADGDYSIIFNLGNRSAGDWIAQTFDTVPGNEYLVSFNLGRLASTQGVASLQVTAYSADGSTLMTQTVRPPVHGYGPLERIVFTATTTNSTLQFLDTSTATAAVDLVLDNVAVIRLPPRRAKATGVVVNGFVVEVNITDGGTGYTNAPNVTIEGGGGTGATAFSTIVNGSVDRVFILNSGSGFTSVPTIMIEPPYAPPSLSISVATVAVKMTVVEGRKYQLESSRDFQAWQAVGAVFVAQTGELTRIFDVQETGQFFRLRDVP